MNKIILLLVSFLAIVSTSAKDTSTVNSFLGKWKSFEDEIISIEYNNKSNEASFSRSFNNEIVSEGIIIVENGFLAVTRKDALLSYKLKDAFSKFKLKYIFIDDGSIDGSTDWLKINLEKFFKKRSI